MSDDTPINLDMFFGSIELVATERRDGDDLVLGGYSIDRDRHGKEVGRTANVDHVRAVDYFKVFAPRKSLWQRIIDALG